MQATEFTNRFLNSPAGTRLVEQFERQAEVDRQNQRAEALAELAKLNKSSGRAAKSLEAEGNKLLAELQENRTAHDDIMNRIANYSHRLNGAKGTAQVRTAELEKTLQETRGAWIGEAYKHVAELRNDLSNRLPTATTEQQYLGGVIPIRVLLSTQLPSYERRATALAELHCWLGAPAPLLPDGEGEGEYKRRLKSLPEVVYEKVAAVKGERFKEAEN